MKVRVYIWAKRGEETFASCRVPGNAEALKRTGWTVFAAEAHLPDWLDVADEEVKATMHRSLTPGSMPAVGGEKGR